MSLVDYTNIVSDIEEAKDPEVVKAGTEVQVRIISVNTGTSEKNNCDWFMPKFEVVGMPEAKEFSDFHWVLNRDKLDAKAFARSLNKFKNFAKAFGLDYTRPFDFEDMVGLEGWIIVGMRKDQDYGEQNTVERYIIPR